MKVVETERLILRTWHEKDKEPYFLINQDPKVIEFLPGAMTEEEVECFIRNMNEKQKKHGYSLWAAELKLTGDFIGFVGLNYADFSADFTPAVEIGWRLGAQYWGKGYATEGAKAALDYGFNESNLAEIVSFTVPQNLKSIAVMERLGMVLDLNGGFFHPKLPSSHRLSEHVLYRLTRDIYLGCNKD